MAIKCIVGLGNPEAKYHLNRHNIGFLFVDALANLYQVSWKNEAKFFAQTSKITIDTDDILLVKPTTYMNNSGKSVQSIMQFFKYQASEVLVVHDELDLELGIIKLKLAGGHGGHNGLRDITQQIGSAYYRLRIGIGRPSHNNVSSFVLSNPSDKEQEVLLNAFIKPIEHLAKLTQDPDKAMQIINTKE